MIFIILNKSEFKSNEIQITNMNIIKSSIIDNTINEFLDVLITVEQIIAVEAED